MKQGMLTPILPCISAYLHTCTPRTTSAPGPALQGGLHGLEAPHATHVLGPDSSSVVRLCRGSDLQAYWVHVKTDLSRACAPCG